MAKTVARTAIEIALSSKFTGGMSGGIAVSLLLNIQSACIDIRSSFEFLSLAAWLGTLRPMEFAESIFRHWHALLRPSEWHWPFDYRIMNH